MAGVFARHSGASMIVGASAGSTGGGLKVSRVVILMRAAKRSCARSQHPHTVKVITVDGKPVWRRCGEYLFYIVCADAAASVLPSARSTAMTARRHDGSLATFNNIGPWPRAVRTGGELRFSRRWRRSCCASVCVGRLELYPLRVLLMPSTWRGVIAGFEARDPKPVTKVLLFLNKNIENPPLQRRVMRYMSARKGTPHPRVVRFDAGVRRARLLRGMSGHRAAARITVQRISLQ